ncbi:MAG: hypothetical protein PVF57_11900 [Pseudomonadales bacterium]|jgi:DNA-binding MarR family transcriptional regulator
MEPYDYLIRVLDTFIEVTDGAIPIRRIQNLLIVQKATHFGSGISASEVSRLTGSPLENVRRQLGRQKARGLLETHADPTDDRVTLFRTTAAGEREWQTTILAQRLHAIGPLRDGKPGAPHPLSPQTYDALIAILQAFADAFEGGMRIRGFKTAMLIQLATLSGSGVTASELSRRTSAALETVRRHMAKHIALGDLRIVEDPEDERANRVFSAHPERESARFAAVAARLDAIDWNVFNIA